MSDSGHKSFANSYMKNEGPVSSHDDSLDALRHTEDFEPGIASKHSQGRNRGPLTEDFTPKSAQPHSAFKTIAENSNADDQESISNYMNQLLARVNKGVDQAIKEEAAPPNQAQKAMPAVNAGETLEENDDSEPVTVEVRLPKRAPEDRDGLLNMRKVANESASDALKAYDCRQLIGQIRGKVILTIAALCVSCILALTSASAVSLAYAGSILAMLTAAAGFWSYQTLTRKLKQSIQTSLGEEIGDGV